LRKPGAESGRYSLNTAGFGVKWSTRIDGVHFQQCWIFVSRPFSCSPRERPVLCLTRKIPAITNASDWCTFTPLSVKRMKYATACQPCRKASSRTKSPLWAKFGRTVTLTDQFNRSLNPIRIVRNMGQDREDDFRPEVGRVRS
jgi:hypothetical protein